MIILLIQVYYVWDLHYTAEYETLLFLQCHQFLDESIGEKQTTKFIKINKQSIELGQ